MVGWIFVQLQYVYYSLNQESDRIDDLLKQIQESQNQQIDQLNQRVDKNQNLALYQMAGGEFCFHHCCRCRVSLLSCM